MRFKSNALKQRESARKYRYRQQSAEIVRQRWERNGRRCEGCGLVADVIEVAHLVSKAGHIIPDKYASTPELCAALCCAATWGDRIGCHELIDRNLDLALQTRLRWDGYWRFAAAHRLRGLFTDAADPLGALRDLVRQLEAREEGRE